MNPQEFKQSLQDTIEKTWKEGFDKGVEVGMGVYLKVLTEAYQRGALTEESVFVISSQMELELKRIMLEQRLSVR